MSKFRVDLLFNRVGTGWSEVWYREAASIQTASETALNLINARRSPLNQACNVVGYRITPLSDNGLKDGLGVTINTASRGYVGLQTEGPDNPAVSTLVVCGEGSGQRSKHFWMRGMSDDSTTYNTAGFQNDVPAFDNDFDVLRQYVKNAGAWLMRHFDMSSFEGRTSAVQTFSLGDDEQFAVHTTTPLSVAPGERVKIAGYPRRGVLKGINGFVRVVSQLDETTIHIAKGSESLTAGDYPGLGARILKEKYIFDTITSMEPARSTKHNAGRPFFSTRGRRSAARPSNVTLVGAV